MSRIGQLGLAVGRFGVTEREVVRVPSVSSFTFGLCVRIGGISCIVIDGREFSLIFPNKKSLWAAAFLCLFANHRECAFVSFSVQIWA